MKDAIGEAELLKKLRVGMFPPPQFDVAVTIYERNPDGAVSDKGVVSFERPQDFAVGEYWQYARFGVMQHKGGEMFCWLVHMYWDGDRDEDSARDIVLNSTLAYGQWQPTAPSDPLLEDDFWDEKLGPAVYFDNDVEPLFDNFGKKAYVEVRFGEGGEG